MWSHTYCSILKFLMFHMLVSGTPTVVVTRPLSRVKEWLPIDNQTVYRVEDRMRRFELNTTLISDTSVFVTVSPCTKDIHWAVFKGRSDTGDGHLVMVAEYHDNEVHTFTTVVSKHDRYVLQLSSSHHGVAAVSVRGETSKPSRLRLRIRSKRRLSANWNPSQIDPQSTSYCVVASKQKPYTSLCAAHYESKTKSNEITRTSSEQTNKLTNTLRNETTPKPVVNVILNGEMDRFNYTIQKEKNKDYGTQIKFLESFSEGSENMINDIDDWDTFNVYSENFKSAYRKRKYSRSTKLSDEDPVIACVGDRTHHFIEDLDPITTYYVSVFGVGKDRQAGTLLASSSVKPKTTIAKRLRENIPFKAEVRGKLVLYYKSMVGIGKGLWISLTTCSGAADVEILARGKRLQSFKNIDPHKNFFVPAPIVSSSAQDTNDESIQFDSSSSEEARIRYIIRVTPSRKEDRESGVGVEITASTSRWNINTPELADDGDVVRELRPKRTCHSVDVAFLPATHHAADMIRYCIVTQEYVPGEPSQRCLTDRKERAKTQCVNLPQESTTKAIVRKVTGLKPGLKYEVQVTASNKGNTVPYKTLYTETNISCKNSTYQ